MLYHLYFGSPFLFVFLRSSANVKPKSHKREDAALHFAACVRCVTVALHIYSYTPFGFGIKISSSGIFSAAVCGDYVLFCMIVQHCVLPRVATKGGGSGGKVPETVVILLSEFLLLGEAEKEEEKKRKAA